MFAEFMPDLGEFLEALAAYLERHEIGIWVDVPADPGDPEADPPVPPTAARVRNIFCNRWGDEPDTAILIALTAAPPTPEGTQVEVHFFTRDIDGMEALSLNQAIYLLFREERLFGLNDADAIGAETCGLCRATTGPGGSIPPDDSGRTRFEITYEWLFT